MSDIPVAKVDLVKVNVHIIAQTGAYTMRVGYAGGKNSVAPPSDALMGAISELATIAKVSGLGPRMMAAVSKVLDQ